MPLEVELKFGPLDPTGLPERLLALGARFVKQKRQEDRYFNHPSRDFASTDEALRLRLDGGQNRVTYKGPKLDALTKTRLELEVPFAEGAEHRDQFAELLTKLGFRPVRIVGKTRDVYNLEWRAHALEIAIDRVDGLGTFVELETAATPETLAAARTAVTELAAQLEIAPNERRSYLELLLAAG